MPNRIGHASESLEPSYVCRCAAVGKSYIRSNSEPYSPTLSLTVARRHLVISLAYYVITRHYTVFNRSGAHGLFALAIACPNHPPITKPLLHDNSASGSASANVEARADLYRANAYKL